MTLPFSVALQLALTLASVPALALAGQIFQPVPTALSTKYASSFSDEPLSQAQRRVIPSKDVSNVIAAASAAADHSSHGEALPPGPHGIKTASATSLIPAKGLVLKMDRANATVKIDHDPIPALDWPRMTMPFRLKERALAEQVREGDVVEFFLEKSGSDYVIVKFGKPVSTKALP
ncbi:MAG: copper-binding protein [Pseudomonadota bacterium]|nr:copper-binding protein [Pseudomonadota bacterium]